MSRGRKVVKVYIPIKISSILALMVEKLGLSESEIFRISLIEYAKSLGLL